MHPLLKALRTATASKGRLLIVVLIAGLSLFLILHFSRSPSHNRQWEPYAEVLPYATRSGDTVTIHGFRDFSYTPQLRITNFRRSTRPVHLHDLQSLWFIKEDFGAFPGFAHTMLSFGTRNGDYLVFSVEARKENGEKYSGWLGLWRQFELMIQVGTERDFIGKRTHQEIPPPVYLYPVPHIKDEHLQALFLSLLAHMNRIREKPQWYNTLSSNCTNVLYRHAEKATGINIPISLNTILPGYSDKTGYQLGILPNQLPFEENRKKYLIEPSLIEWNDPNFFQKIRRGKQP